MNIAINVKTEKDGWFELSVYSNLEMAKLDLDFYKKEDTKNNEICQYRVIDLDTEEVIKI